MKNETGPGAGDSPVLNRAPLASRTPARQRGAGAHLDGVLAARRREERHAPLLPPAFAATGLLGGFLAARRRAGATVASTWTIRGPSGDQSARSSPSCAVTRGAQAAETTAPDLWEKSGAVSG